MSNQFCGIFQTIGSQEIWLSPLATFAGAGPSALAQDIPAATAALSLLALLLAVAAMIVAFRSLAQSRRLRRSGEGVDPAASLRTRATELEAMMRDAEELSQRIAAELDARAAALERLLVRADRIGAMAERELEVGQRTPGRSDGQDPISDAHRRIYELADEGHSPVEIARRLSQTQGQVELTLSLRRMRQGSERA